jgi:hypothetical protein
LNKTGKTVVKEKASNAFFGKNVNKSVHFFVYDKCHFPFTSETTGNLIVLEPFTMPTRYESKFNNVLIMRDIAKYFKGNAVLNSRGIDPVVDI